MDANADDYDDDYDDDDRDDSPYCDCGAIHDDIEEGFNRCGCCGKMIE